MENTQQRLLQNPFDPGAVWGAYIAFIDAWKENAGALAQDRGPKLGQGLNNDAAFENVQAQMQKSGEDIFRHAVELQIELCRFFGKRWEQYLDLPPAISHCHSTADIAQVESAFLTKMAADYGLEAKRLGQAFQVLGSDWMAAARVSFIPKETLHH